MCLSSGIKGNDYLLDNNFHKAHDRLDFERTHHSLPYNIICN
jgi:hypothetical protein